MIKVLYIGLFGILLLVFIGLVSLSQESLRAPGPYLSEGIMVETLEIIVKPNETARQTINTLGKSGLIRSQIATLIYLKFTGMDQKIKPGAYRLSTGWDVPQIISELTQGPKDFKVTIPEGWRREQIATRLASTLPGFDISDFLSQTASLEGQLFPDTYFIPPAASASEITAILLANFAKKSGLDIPAQTESLILASLVEREAKADPDRAIIAGILNKRLEAGWPLQVDATAQYAQGTPREWWPQNIDTKYPSVYNTYLQPGLPPAPIANPGLASIQAVLSPQASPYWYYLTGNDGQMYYAPDLANHNLNIDKHLSP